MICSHGDAPVKVASRADVSTEVETSLIVPVTQAMADVEPWRERLDPFSARGMPTHVTVEYPFLPPAALDDGLHASLAAIFDSVPAFEFELTGVRWFDDRVVWLAPEPDARFRQLTASVMDRWPTLRSYGGSPGLVPPHLTIGVSEPRERLEEAARALEPLLPIACTAEEVWLMAGSSAPRSWTIESRFLLAANAA
jgi:2'-5' RNA ligase